MDPVAASPDINTTDGQRSSLSLAESGPSVSLHVALPDGFSLAAAVCSYGFFMMAPTVWIPPRGSESTAPRGLEVKRETEEAAVADPGRAEAKNGKGDAGRDDERGATMRAAGSGQRGGGEGGSGGRAWERGERAWGAMERALRLADGRAVMVRLTQHRAADVAQLVVDVMECGGDGAADQKGPDADVSSCASDVTREVCSAGGAADGPGDGSGSRSGCDNSRSVPVTSGYCLRVRVMGLTAISQEDRTRLLCQVRRMLRLSPACLASLRAFHRLHPAAAAAGFGRLFRSPALFEDLVKAQLLCNCGWGRTLAMARALCQLHAHHFGPPIGARDSHACIGAFPEPHELAGLEIQYLTSRCGLGYRGPRIARLAADVASGAIDLAALERGCLQSGVDVAVVEWGRVESGGAESGCGREEEGGMERAGDLAAPADAGAHRAVAALAARVYSRKRRRGAQEQGCAVELQRGRSDGLMLPAGGGCVLPAVEARMVEHQQGCSAAVERQQCGGAGAGSRKADEARGQGKGRAMEEAPWEEAARRRVLNLPGFGPYSSANVLQCMGVFCFVPADSETIRYLKHVKGHASCTPHNAESLAAQAYAPYAPFQFLAYWWEIWQDYERVFGPMAHLSPSRYHLITGHNMRKEGVGRLEAQGDVDAKLAGGAEWGVQPGSAGERSRGSVSSAASSGTRSSDAGTSAGAAMAHGGVAPGGGCAHDRLPHVRAPRSMVSAPHGSAAAVPPCDARSTSSRAMSARRPPQSTVGRAKSARGRAEVPQREATGRRARAATSGTADGGGKSVAGAEMGAEGSGEDKKARAAGAVAAGGLCGAAAAALAGAAGPSAAGEAGAASGVAAAMACVAGGVCTRSRSRRLAQGSQHSEGSGAAASSPPLGPVLGAKEGGDVSTCRKQCGRVAARLKGVSSWACRGVLEGGSGVMVVEGGGEKEGGRRGK
ncbi:hypothetical protein CLOM_g16868 [Closterium sp. NIES-68]|nr:hypothetical protein CLOM_g16868 [Closterium sp. NIES-68]